jgi:NAD(P)-dependent dehydrogenase (short-subunit alcohol dehydrogenase family)
MQRPNQQVIVISGSSSGFGRRAAERLASRGHIVFATMRETDGRNAPHAEALRQRSQSQGWDLRVVEMDVTNDASVNQAISTVISQVGRIDALINNAGIWGPGVLEAFTIPQWRQVFDVNVFGAVRAARAVLPVMRGQAHGFILQVSSLQGRFILPYSGPYVASKWAAEGMAETLRYEVAPLGVEVCVLEPYDFMTEMKDKAPGYAAHDASVSSAYGDADAFIQGAYLVPDPTRAGDPAEVVDAMVALIEMPSGTRPARTTVRNPMPQIEQINALTSEMHHALYPMIGLGHLLAVRSNASQDATAGAVPRKASLASPTVS